MTKRFLLRTGSVAVVLSLAVAPVTAEVVTLSPVQDNSIYSELSGGSNGAGVFLFSGNTGAGDQRRALLQFDVGGLPSGATVTSALCCVRGPG